MTQIYKIFGPPGTGKTTYLLSLLEKEFKNVHPSQCAFVSFTRKGTYEGVERALGKFNLVQEELRYFRTIHSMCFSELGLYKEDIIQKQHFKQFSDATGLRFLGYYTEELKSGNDQYLFAEQLLRNNQRAFLKFSERLNMKTLKWVVANYRKFKKQLQLLDFTDLLELYIDRGSALPVKVAFIDEAQDLTTLQWEVVRKMFKDCERVYLAGDDDQAIYEWSGADVAAFLQHPGKALTLSKSYRLPDAIHAYALRVVKNISYRAQKDFRSNGLKGSVSFTSDWKDADLAEDTLILSRNKRYLDGAEKALREQGLCYIREEERSVDKRKMRAIQKYEAWRKDQGTRQEVMLYGSFFKEIDKRKPWYAVFNDSSEDILYYRRVIGYHRAWEEKPKIELATIHSSKGSERKSVIVIMAISPRVALNLDRNPDSELRCLYVGVTRAKQKLTIFIESTKYSYPLFTNQEDNNECR